MPNITITLTEKEAGIVTTALRRHENSVEDKDDSSMIAAWSARRVFWMISDKVVEAEKNADHDRIQASAGRKARRITKGLNEKGEYTERLGLGDFRYWSASRPLDPFTKIVVTEWRRIPRGATERQYQGLKNALQCEIFDKVEG